MAVHSPAGEAQEEMSLPFDERQLRDKLKDLEIALLRSGGTQRALSTEEQTVQEFGRSLFEAVLVGKVGTCYYRSMDQAQQEGKGLRLEGEGRMRFIAETGPAGERVKTLRRIISEEAQEGRSVWVNFN